MTTSLTCEQVFVLKAKTEETSYAKMNAAEEKQIGQQSTHEKTDWLHLEQAQQVNEEYSIRH